MSWPEPSKPDSWRIRAKKRLEVIPDATHLFEEPGALERVAALATDWFTRHFTSPVRT